MAYSATAAHNRATGTMSCSAENPARYTTPNLKALLPVGEGFRPRYQKEQDAFGKDNMQGSNELQMLDTKFELRQCNQRNRRHGVKLSPSQALSLLAPFVAVGCCSSRCCSAHVAFDEPTLLT